MSDKSLLEEIQREELKGASAEDKFRAKLASCSDYEFKEVARYLCNLGDQEKQRQASQPPAPREPSEEDRRLSGMTMAQYKDHLRSIGVNADYLEEPLSDGRRLPE